MGNNQGLHGQGVLFHQVGDAGVGIDDNLISEPHLAPLVALGGVQELLAE